MTLLNRYIAKNVLVCIVFVTLIIAALHVFILFVNQFDDIGHADFKIWQAIKYVFLQMPYQVYLFFPMASLLGSLIGLGIMANHRELIVMRAAGLSIFQITGAVLRAALFLVVIVTVIGETLIPQLTYHSNDLKMQALSGGQTLRTAQGVWLRYQNNFISIGTIQEDDTLQGVYQFRFDEQQRLRLARQIKEINYINGEWQAHDIAETLIHDNKTEVHQISQMLWDVNVKPSLLSVNTSDPDEMTLSELRRYISEGKRSSQASTNYQLVYWQRLMQPFTTFVMMILAIPFIFGPLRSSTMGTKFLIGATVGFSFHLINRFFGPATEVLQWPPIIAALAPTLLFAMLGIYLMQRVR